MGKKKANLAALSIDGDIMLMVMSCCCLGLLFYVNFLVRFFYGFPLLQSPGGSLSYAEIGSLAYYTKAGNYPWSLSSLFWWITLISSSLVVVVVWFKSRNLGCKWRLRFLSLLMSFFCFGFAALSSHIEGLIVKDTEYYILYLKEHLKVVQDEPIWKNQILREIRLSEDVLKRWQESK